MVGIGMDAEKAGLKLGQVVKPRKMVMRNAFQPMMLFPKRMMQLFLLSTPRPLVHSV